MISQENVCVCIYMSNPITCACLTQKRTRCRNVPRKGSRFCYLHQNCEQEATHVSSVPRTPRASPVPYVSPASRDKTTRKEHSYRPESEPKPPEKKVECQKLGGLVNRSNSCYMDSLLFSILHVRNIFIDRYFLYRDLDQLTIPETHRPLSQSTDLYEITKTLQWLLRDF